MRPLTRPLLTLVFWAITRLLALVLFVQIEKSFLLSQYSSFLAEFVARPSLDPWLLWQELGGDPWAFPYGWPMLLFASIPLFVIMIFGTEVTTAYLLVLLGADFLTLILLIQMKNISSDNPGQFVSTAYSLAPVPIMLLGVIGVTDFFPMLFLLGSFLAVANNRVGLGGALMGAAVGSKIILVVVLVGPLLYLRRSNSRADSLIIYLAFFLLITIISLSPVAYSQSFRSSLLSSSEASGPLSIGIAYQGGTVLVAPILVAAIWYFLYRQKRMNIDLLALSLAVPLVVVAAIPGAPEGWILWAFPLVLFLASSMNLRPKIFVVTALNFPSILLVWNLFFSFSTSPLSSAITDLLSTASLSLLGILIVVLWDAYIRRGDFSRLHARPALVLISGDSGTGKDTLASGLETVLGPRTTLRLSGDDYHRRNRASPSWKRLTHLNPSENQLNQFVDDILELRDGSRINSQHYDHNTGRIKSGLLLREREFIVASGLHCLMFPDLNRQAELSIFMEMSEDMRIRLKLDRDTTTRGHSHQEVLDSLLKREKDSREHIDPQRQNASLIISASYEGPPEFYNPNLVKLEFEAEAKPFDQQLVSELLLTCGLESHIERIINEKQKLTVRGSSTPDHLSAVFARLEPRVATILGNPNGWADGPAGLVQLVTMVHLANALRRERLVI